MSYSIILSWEYFESLPKMKLKTAKEFNVHWRCPHLRAQGDSLKGACAAKCLKFDLEKFENSTISLKGACPPMRGNRVSNTVSNQLSRKEFPHLSSWLTRRTQSRTRSDIWFIHQVHGGTRLQAAVLSRTSTMDTTVCICDVRKFLTS